MNRKHILSLLVAICFGTFGYAQQATMPTIIVFPADKWMQDHGFMQTIDNDGETEYIPKYNDAFVQTRDMGAAIAGLQKVFEERGFQHQDLHSLIKDAKRERAEELANAADGDASEKNMMDELMQQANPDIRVDFDYGVTTVGPRKNISFAIKAVDAYTSEQCALVEGNIEMTMDPIDLAIRKAVAGKCDEFCQELINYFLDLRDNGRKINIIFRAAAGSGIDFLNDETDSGDTYQEFISEWISSKAVNNSATEGRQTKNVCEMKNVRIPFFDETGKPTKTAKWARGIRKEFEEATGIKIANGQGNTLGRVNFLVGKE